MHEGRDFRPGYKIKLDLERARLLTYSYKQTESEPIVLRRANALAHILEKMTIFIRDEELIVGNFSRDLDSVAHYPELQWRWVDKTTAPGQIYSDLLSEEEWKELKELHEYGKTRAVHGKEREYLPKGMEDAWVLKGQYFFAYHWEHSTPNYDKLFGIGFNGILKEIKERMDKLDEEVVEEKVSAEEYADKKNFLDAAEIAVSAATKWIKRYAKLAKEKAEKEENEQRKRELEKIAENCEWISENPPKTLY